MRLRADSVAWRRLGEEVVLLDRRTSSYLATNPTATFLWQRLEAGTTRDALVESLAAEYGMTAQDVAPDVDEFLADCRARDLLAFDGDPGK